MIIMNNKLYFITILMFLLIPIVMGSQTNLGIFKQNTCINLQESCADCTYVNLTSVSYPNSTYLLSGNVEMTGTSGSYNYTICNTTAIGNYIYCVKGDPGGVEVSECVNFEVNDRGVGIRDNSTNLAIIITMLVLVGIGIFLTIYFDNFLRLPFFLGTTILVVYSLNLLSNIASDAGASLVVVNLLWFGYKIGIYLFWALCLYVLVKLTMELRIQNNPAPMSDSPLKQKRSERLKRQGRWQ